MIYDNIDLISYESIKSNLIQLFFFFFFFRTDQVRYWLEQAVGCAGATSQLWRCGGIFSLFLLHAVVLGALRRADPTLGGLCSKQTCILVVGAIWFVGVLVENLCTSSCRSWPWFHSRISKVLKFMRQSCWFSKMCRCWITTPWIATWIGTSTWSIFNLNGLVTSAGLGSCRSCVPRCQLWSRGIHRMFH